MPQLEWAFENLESTLEDVGFDSVDWQITSNDRDPNMRALTSQIWIGACRSGLQMRMKLGIKPAPATEALLEDLVTRMLKEVDDGAYGRFNIHIWTAFKHKS